jgi:uncharacterized protein (DUF433 family)
MEDSNITQEPLPPDEIASTLHAQELLDLIARIEREQEAFTTEELRTLIGLMRNGGSRLERLPKAEMLKSASVKTPAITTNPKRMGGEPLIGIERMPVTTLLDHIILGYTLEQFSEIFGTPVENCQAALRVLRTAIDEELVTDIIAQPVDY